MIQEPGNPAVEARCFLFLFSYQLCTLGFLPRLIDNHALLRVLPSCPNSPEDGAVRCFFVGGVSMLLVGFHLVPILSDDRTMRRAYLPSCPNFSEDGDRWPSPRISILNK